MAANSTSAMRSAAPTTGPTITAIFTPPLLWTVVGWYKPTDWTLRPVIFWIEATDACTMASEAAAGTKGSSGLINIAPLGWWI